MSVKLSVKRVLVFVLLVLGMVGLAAGSEVDGNPATPELKSYPICVCNYIDVWSVYRWMDPWWGLECNNHCGHGYVGSSCDTAHGAGCGAMTGYVKIRDAVGAEIASRNCPDDHATCFRGPSACDSGGSWGNTCNADTWHCVPGGQSGGEWDCNSLADGTVVYQHSAVGVAFWDACGTGYFNVLEKIQEEDPFCCDDFMGYLNANIPTLEGSWATYVGTGDVNCNGGSQGGVPPNCGQFGATLAVVTSCYTAYTATATAGVTGTVEKNSLKSVIKEQHQELTEEQYQALAESIERRAEKMATISREFVTGEVAERAADYGLGVSAPVPELTDLLIKVGYAELEQDRCRVENRGKAQLLACRRFENQLDQLSTDFQKISGGLTPWEFRTGSALYKTPESTEAPEDASMITLELPAGTRQGTPPPEEIHSVKIDSQE